MYSFTNGDSVHNDCTKYSLSSNVSINARRSCFDGTSGLSSSSNVETDEDDDGDKSCEGEEEAVSGSITVNGNKFETSLPSSPSFLSFSSGTVIEEIEEDDNDGRLGCSESVGGAVFLRRVRALAQGFFFLSIPLPRFRNFVQAFFFFPVLSSRDNGISVSAAFTEEICDSSSSKSTMGDITIGRYLLVALMYVVK